MHKQWQTEEEESLRLIDLILHGRDEDLVKHLAQLPVKTRRSASTHLAKDGNSALHLAALRERLGGLAAMLDAKVDVGIHNGSGESPLYVCMCHNALKAARLLVNNGTDVNEVTGRKENETLLHKMVKGDRCGAVEILLDAGVNMDSQTRHGDTPLHYAARFNRPMITRLLLQGGATVNLTNEKKETPLHMAVANRTLDVAKILIKVRARVDVPDRQGMTTLHLAVASGAMDLVRLMLNSNSTHVNSKERLMGRTPLLLACSGTHQKLAPLLLSHGADANLTTNYRKTVLHLAASAGNTHALNAVIKHASNLNALATNNKTPLHCAVSAGQLEAVRTLLRAGVNPNLKDIEGDTALHMAAAAGDSRIAGQLLLQPGLHVNATNMRQRTALHAALMAGHEQTGGVLLAAGCDPDMLDVFEKNAAHYLEDYRRSERELLEKDWPSEHEASKVRFDPNDDDEQLRASPRDTPEVDGDVSGQDILTTPTQATGSKTQMPDNMDNGEEVGRLPVEKGDMSDPYNGLNPPMYDLDRILSNGSAGDREDDEEGDEEADEEDAQHETRGECDENNDIASPSSEASPPKKSGRKSKHRHRKTSKSSDKGGAASSPRHSRSSVGKGRRPSRGSASGDGGGHVLGMVVAGHNHEHHEQPCQKKATSHQHESSRRRKFGVASMK